MPKQVPTTKPEICDQAQLFMRWSIYEQKANKNQCYIEYLVNG